MNTRSIALMVTSDQSILLIGAFANYLTRQGWNVHVISSPGPNLAELARETIITTHALPMARSISIRQDIQSIFRAWRLLRRLRPDIISAGTPKAGLIGTLAGLGVLKSKRIYLLRGLRLETTQGLSRALLHVIESLVCSISTETVAISSSLRERAITLRVARPDRIVTVGPGSSNGVDIARFMNKDRVPHHDGSVVLGFVGRVTPDKGLDLLADALAVLARRNIFGTLILVGGDDSLAAPQLRAQLRASGWTISELGHTNDVESVYSAIDILCLPTKREGFGNVIIEAAAAGVPSIVTRATGVIDAVEDKVTGIVVNTRDPNDYANAIESLLDKAHREAMGTAAQHRAASLFRRETVWAAYDKYYSSLLA